MFTAAKVTTQRLGQRRRRLTTIVLSTAKASGAVGSQLLWIEERRQDSRLARAQHALEKSGSGVNELGGDRCRP